jgi:HlyD family secretion protein
MKKWIIIIVVLVVLAGAFYLLGPARAQRQAASASGLQTTTASRGSLTASVGATGIVRANQTAILSWQTTGTVGEINVQVGEMIQAEQLLASLESTSLQQSVILAQADLVNAQRALDDLLNSNSQKAQAQQAVENARQALEDAKNPELAQAKALEAIAFAEKAVQDAERNVRWLGSPATQSLIDEAQAQVVIVKDRLDTAQEKFDPYANRPESNLTRARLQSELAQVQQLYDAAVRQLNNLQGTASETDQAVAKADLATARAQLLQAQREWERIKDGTSPAELALLEAQLADAERELERVQDGAAPEDILAAQARVDAAQATINLARLTAPFAGTITDVMIKPGDQATPGTMAFRLDDLTHLLIDVSVSEVDINRIQIGQPVSLTFDAIQGKEYSGEISKVDQVGTNNQGIVDFTVTVELNNPDEQVKTGMTAAVNIVVNQLEDVLLVPNRAVRIRDGKRVVFILSDGQAMPVEINLGASSDVNSEVISGDLREGDTIVLNPPVEFSTNGPPPFVRR